MTISSTSKATIFIGTNKFAPSTTALALTDYTAGTPAEVYTAIGSVMDLDDFGDTAESVKFTSIDSGRVLKVKGARDAGQLKLQCAYDALDAGQAALIAASLDDFNRSIKVVFADPPNATTGKPSTIYFRGLVMSATNKLGTANNLITLEAIIELNSPPFRVPASAS